MESSQYVEVVNAKAVAESFRVCLPTAVQMIREGKIRGQKVGRNWRVNASDLDDLRETIGLPRIYSAPKTPSE